MLLLRTRVYVVYYENLLTNAVFQIRDLSRLCLESSSPAVATTDTKKKKTQKSSVEAASIDDGDVGGAEDDAKEITQESERD